MTTKGLVYVYGRGDKIPDDVIKINVTSRSSDEWSRKFSPFHLGPIKIYPFSDEDDYVSKNMENAWQFLKVYPEQDEWLKWAEKGWNSDKAFRFPFGRSRKPLHSKWKGKNLPYIKARFEIYAPLYAECVEKYAKIEFDKIKSYLDEGKSVALFDYDGYNYIYNEVSLKDVIYNSRRKMGHAFVLAMMLNDCRIWENSLFDVTQINNKTMRRSKY